MKSLKLLVVTLSIAMLMAVSACATTPPPTPVPTQMLTDGEAELVVATYMVSHVGLPLVKNCLGDVGDPISHETSYHESGNWKVQVNSCLFIVDDSTGKVTGP
tara:strand:+ start:236 stop:544 length:309 start_codon:yes stop_codon:yes gene_type:complete